VEVKSTQICPLPGRRNCDFRQNAENRYVDGKYFQNISCGGFKRLHLTWNKILQGKTLQVRRASVTLVGVTTLSREDEVCVAEILAKRLKTFLNLCGKKADLADKRDG